MAELKLVDENFTEADIEKLIAAARVKASETHPHAKRFEVVQTAAGPVALCNASRAQATSAGGRLFDAARAARDGSAMARAAPVMVPDASGKTSATVPE